MLKTYQDMFTFHNTIFGQKWAKFVDVLRPIEKKLRYRFLHTDSKLDDLSIYEIKMIP